MRILTLAIGFLMVAGLAAGHVEKRSATSEGDRRPAPGAVVSLPVSAPAGVEVLLIVR
jgi:hypothetical protein